jgi:hypothetical protein
MSLENNINAILNDISRGKQKIPKIYSIRDEPYKLLDLTFNSHLIQKNESNSMFSKDDYDLSFDKKEYRVNF